MLVYRLGKTAWAENLDGEGARLFGGRWNNVGTACIYTSETRALAMLEYSVNINIDDIPRALSFTEIEIPDDIQIFSLKELPGDWNHNPAPGSTKDFGDKNLKLLKHAVLRFPSSVIKDEFNYVLNPQHPGAKKFRVRGVRDFSYDVRVKGR